MDLSIIKYFKKHNLNEFTIKGKGGGGRAW